MISAILRSIGGVSKLLIRIRDSIRDRNIRQRARNKAVMEGEIEQADRDKEAYKFLADERSKPSRGSDFDEWLRGRRKEDGKQV